MVAAVTVLARMEKAQKLAAAKEEASKTANYLAATPAGTATTVDRDTLKAMLLDHNGQVLHASGAYLDIKNKHLGAGVYRVWL